MKKSDGKVQDEGGCCGREMREGVNVRGCNLSDELESKMRMGDEREEKILKGGGRWRMER